VFEVNGNRRDIRIKDKSSNSIQGYEEAAAMADPDNNMEIGASIRERYQVQAQKCKPQFLYRAMKLCNDCDLNYRTSKNKKLLVEIMLIQVAQLSEESDDVSHGRSPKQIIKPIFSQQDATVMQAASVSMPQATAPVAPTQAVHVNPIPTVGKETKVPTLKVGNLSISIKNPRQKAQSQAEVIAIKEQTPTTSFAENKSFDEETLNYHWKQYATSLPPEDNAMAGRMMNMSVRLLNETNFEAVVDNEAVEKYMREIVSPIQSYLRENLHNRNIKMIVRISAPTENIKAYGRVERFQMMSDKNPVLLKLKNVFGLELS
ncbi:MAG: hypothetical protein RR371_00315, partial [Bacteroides sp.]